jgi:hypothetical protein
MQPQMNCIRQMYRFAVVAAGLSPKVPAPASCSCSRLLLLLPLLLPFPLLLLLLLLLLATAPAADPNQLSLVSAWDSPHETKVPLETLFRSLQRHHYSAAIRPSQTAKESKPAVGEHGIHHNFNPLSAKSRLRRPIYFVRAAPVFE